MRSFFSMWMGEVAMKVCTRGDLRLLHRLAAARGRRCSLARASPHTVLSLIGARHRPHRLEIAVARGRESGLDHVDPHALELPRDAQLLFARHRGAGALLAVAHRGVEYDQSFLCHDASPSVMATAVSHAAPASE